MIRSLIAKELREQLRVIVALAAFLVMTLAYEFVVASPDQRPLPGSFDDWFAGDAETGFVILLIYQWVANGTFVRERDDGTLRFLDSLPVSRSLVFGVKFAVIFAIVSLWNLSGFAFPLACHALSRDSIHVGFYASVLWPSLVILSSVDFVLLALATLLSFARGFSWVLACLIPLVGLWLERSFPHWEWLNPLTLGEPVFVGATRAFPAALGTHLLLAAGFLCLSALLFQRLGRPAPGFHFSVPGGFARAALATGWIAVIGVGVGMIDGDADDLELEAVTEGIVLPPVRDATGATEYFAASYPEASLERAEGLLEQADSAYRKVADFLGVTTAATPVTLDLSGAARGTLGTSVARTVRIDLANHDGLDELIATLAHETAHVLLDRLTQERVASDGTSGRLFHEGLASYIEYRFFRPEGSVETARSVAGILRARGEVDFALAANAPELYARHAHELVYPLGEIFFAACVARYGDATPASVLRAIGEADHEQELSGLELWRDAFQAAGANFDVVVGDFEASLDRLADRHAELAASLPRLYGAFEQDSDTFYLDPVAANETPWTIVARTRTERDADWSLTRRLWRGAGGRFEARRDSVSGDTFHYQLGLEDPGSDRVVWEPWSEQSLAP